MRAQTEDECPDCPDGDNFRECATCRGEGVVSNIGEPESEPDYGEYMEGCGHDPSGGDCDYDCPRFAQSNAGF
ncbi:hypothetical protein SSPS47_35145 (plasmid) [Streptomyces sp. S4.7]|nr:hypothetical protein SSPS47_35145 [Streptomyces sp. S4.7]